jgi:hypothetical protein
MSATQEAPGSIPPSHVEFCSNPGTVWRTKQAPAAKGTPGVQEYAALVKDLLDAEDKRGSNMETRAIAVVTASGTLVTLLLGLAALVTRVDAFDVPVGALAFAGISVGLFTASACSAMLAVMPSREWGLKPGCLKSELWERWADADDDAVAKTTATRLALWESSNRQTQRKAVAVFVSTVLLFGASAALAVAVFIVLASAR